MSAMNLPAPPPPPPPPSVNPVIKLDPQTSEKLKVTVIDILKTSDLDSITEKHVRDLASQRLHLDLSDLPFKIFIRNIVETFLLDPNDPALSTNSINDDNPVNIISSFVIALPAINHVTSHQDKAVPNASCRVICKLSEKRDVAVRSSGGVSTVSIREVSLKDGRLVPTCKGISLSSDQWSIFSKSIPAIEDAIEKLESRLRSHAVKKEAHDDIAKIDSNQNGVGPIGPEPMRKAAAHHKPGLTAEPADAAPTLPSGPLRFVPIQIIRFNGKNYQQWADCMESYLKSLKIAYVLSDPCPSSVGVTIGQLSEALSAVQKWVEDDHVCRQNILNSLCDNLFGQYSKKTGSAKDLWDELRCIYLYEEHGARVSLVRKYVEFQIVEEKSIFEQVQQLHHIADSLVASGMYVEEKFHVNVIISKLPASWKPFSIDLMKEDYLPVWMLMNHLKAEEEYRGKGNKTEALPSKPTVSPVFQPGRKFGPQRSPMKKPGTPMAYHELDREKKVKFCNICKKKGHLPEQCWFRNSKDTTNEKDNGVQANGNGEGTVDRAGRQ